MGHMLNKKQFKRSEELNRVYNSDKNGFIRKGEKVNQSRIAKGAKPSSFYPKIKEAQEVGLIRQSVVRSHLQDDSWKETK